MAVFDLPACADECGGVCVFCPRTKAEYDQLEQKYLRTNQQLEERIEEVAALRKQVEIAREREAFWKDKWYQERR